jgi:D-hexose-6-phosphate mutarotase
MEINENVRTMDFIGKDDWDRPVYKCIETGHLYKDINMGKGKPELYTCGNEFDGEPGFPIKSELIVTFKTKYEESPYRFNYMMLSRMQSDCEYYLGYGNRNKSRLAGESVATHIERMKELHNSFPEGEKPEWLTFERILEYEKQMSDE